MVFKITVLGDGGVGKTALTVQVRRLFFSSLSPAPSIRPSSDLTWGTGSHLCSLQTLTFAFFLRYASRWLPINFVLWICLAPRGPPPPRRYARCHSRRHPATANLDPDCIPCFSAPGVHWRSRALLGSRFGPLLANSSPCRLSSRRTTPRLRTATGSSGSSMTSRACSRSLTRPDRVSASEP